LLSKIPAATPRNLMPSGDAERLRDVAAATDASSEATSTYQAAPAVAAPFKAT
jgi:hypothetical protein